MASDPLDIKPLSSSAPGVDEAIANLADNVRNMRHDLRTPLSQIIGYSEMLEEQAEDLGPDDFIPDLQKIIGAAYKMLESIDRIFDFDSVKAMRTNAAPQYRGAEESADVEENEKKRPSRVTVETSVGGKILVVDDNENNREVLARRLERAGYESDLAEDGVRALEKIEACSYDLIVLDVMMPGLNGWEVLEKLREKHSIGELPVIMATAIDDSKEMTKSFDFGANDYITKPLDMPVALGRIRTQLSLKNALTVARKLTLQLELRNAFIRNTFGRYCSDAVVEKLLATPEGLNLGGERRKVTVMMTDIRGFTKICESLAAEKVIALLNTYLGVMSEIVNHFEGNINEIMGDGMVIMFGAPNYRENDLEIAVACALEMQKAMKQVNESNSLLGLPEIEMGIGINTGEVIAGNIGSSSRVKYTVVGATINLAARVESFTVGGQLLISESSFNEAPDLLDVRKIVEIVPKGKKEPIKIYEVLGLGGKYACRLDEGEEEFNRLVSPTPISAL